MVNPIRTLVLAAAAATALGLATPAMATPQAQINATLEADAQLWQGLFALAVADEIRKNCDAMEARTVRATSAVWGLYNRARGYGFSRQEIRAFQTADSTEVRMRAEVLAYFAANGVREGVPDTYCALGRSEIAAGTQAGELLRAR
ncbi:MAG: DUF5333 domain-containing protein [Pararhodobacter sp.]